ncbi:MAG: prepilin-type N-terminal cleavage/methylation domain-containing protein [Kiritimatiellae bacterium]|nr:prepilin-type N-terminal cleavage/methylation domain-containing protein [Kiritimatiellia bacterium]
MKHTARRSGFTLIELLIVIAVIGILAGMLVPAIHYVREKARKDECLNNLRQWGTALQGYLDEHRGRFPGYGPTLRESDAWFNVLPPYLGLEPMSEMGEIPHPGSGRKSPFLCPSEPVGFGGLDTSTLKSYFSSYTLNSWIDNAQNEEKFTKRLRLSQLNEQHKPAVTPASFVVFAEVGDGTQMGVDLSTLSEKAFRHSRSFNVCFADGHAENILENDAWNGAPGNAGDNYGGVQWNPNNPDLSGKKGN